MISPFLILKQSEKKTFNSVNLNSKTSATKMSKSLNATEKKKNIHFVTTSSQSLKKARVSKTKRKEFYRRRWRSSANFRLLCFFSSSVGLFFRFFLCRKKAYYDLWFFLFNYFFGGELMRWTCFLRERTRMAGGDSRTLRWWRTIGWPLMMGTFRTIFRGKG